MEDREGRIGYWVSGVAHGSLILWAILGGALFRPQPDHPVRTTQVSTVSGAEFEAMAAAARGAGPVGAEATAVASLPDPVDPSEDGAARPVDAAPPQTSQAEALQAPDAAEAQPDLSDFAPATPVDVATDLPAPSANQTAGAEAPPAMPDTPAAPLAEAQPAQPAQPAPPVADAPAVPVAPRSVLALDASPRPQDRPAGLVEAFNRRVAQAEAARQAELIAAREAAEAELQAAEAERQQAANEEAEAERQAAADAAAARDAAAAEARRQAADAAAQAEAEAARQAAAEAASDAERQAAAAAEEAARQAAAEAAADQAAAEAARQAAADAAAEQERQAAAAREAEADRQAAAEAAEAEAARQAAAAAEAQRQAAADAAAEAERQAAAAEAERQAAAEAERLAEEQRQAAAEAARQAEAERQAEATRQAAAEATRQAAAEAARQAAAEAARQAAAEAAARAEADRQALEDALREAQSGGGGQDTAATGETPGGQTQMIEGGSGASAGLDPLAAAMAAAMAGTGASADPANDPSGPPADMMRLTPGPIDPIQATPLDDPGAGLPMGDPLTLSERDGLRFAIQNCWNMGALSVEASQMTVSVGFTLSPNGLPDQDSLRLAGYQGGSETAAQQAFEVARRAILMCGREGFELPASKYGRWRDVVVDFRPGGVTF